MRLYYCKVQEGNFGDDLNLYLWEKIFPKPIEYCCDDETIFLGIGSLLGSSIPDIPSKKIIFGTGAGYEQEPPKINKFWKFYAVRGPLTAKFCGLSNKITMLDSAYMVLEVFESNFSKKWNFSFMPHHLTAKTMAWQKVCQALGVKFIDPRWPVSDVLEYIANTKILITEALHGAIIADAFRIPWIPVKTGKHILNFKWNDWASSLNMKFSFVSLPAIWNISSQKKLKFYFKFIIASVYLKRIMLSVKPNLSPSDIFWKKYHKLKETFFKMCDSF